MKVSYAQCWEDPQVLTEALQITAEDDVLSIASGGDNTFALLLQNPGSITAVDWSDAQINLVELKMRAIQVLSYEDFVAFVGASHSDTRMELYRQVRGSLSWEARQFWDSRNECLKRGLIHTGKFERYFSKFRKFVLPLIHSARSTDEFLALSSFQDQRKFYVKVWNNLRWKLLFRVFFGKLVLGHLGRSPGHFKYVAQDDVGAELLARTERGLTEVPVSENFFMEYILKGSYTDLQAAHPYLAEANFRFLKDNIVKIKLVRGSLTQLLKNKPPSSYSAFNLSNVFEYMSDNEYAETVKEIIRVSKDGARVAFWTLFIPRDVPSQLAGSIKVCPVTSARLTAADRTFFYGGFHLANIRRARTNGLSVPARKKEVYRNSRKTLTQLQTEKIE